MTFRMRCGGAWGLPLLAGCPWFMTWHDYSVNLGLKWGCRSVPALSRSLLCQVIPLWIWQSSLLLEALYQESDTALDHWRGILYWALLPGEVRHQRPDGKRAQQVKGKRQPWDREFGGSRKLELVVTEQLSPQESGDMRGWGGMLVHCGRGPQPFSFPFYRKGWLCNLEALGRLKRVPLILLLSALMRRLHKQSF